jgi:hypothetical protein
LIYNTLEFEEFKKGLSLTEKGVRLFPKRTLNIFKIIITCLEQVSTDELMEILYFTSRDKLRELYLVPLMEDGERLQNNSNKNNFY